MRKYPPEWIVGIEQAVSRWNEEEPGPSLPPGFHDAVCTERNYLRIRHAFGNMLMNRIMEDIERVPSSSRRLINSVLEAVKISVLRVKGCHKRGAAEIAGTLNYAALVHAYAEGAVAELEGISRCYELMPGETSPWFGAALLLEDMARWIGSTEDIKMSLKSVKCASSAAKSALESISALYSPESVAQSIEHAITCHAQSIQLATDTLGTYWQEDGSYDYAAENAAWERASSSAWECIVEDLLLQLSANGHEPVPSGHSVHEETDLEDSAPAASHF